MTIPTHHHWSQISIQASICSACGRAVNVKQAKEFAFCSYCGVRMGREEKRREDRSSGNIGG